MFFSKFLIKNSLSSSKSFIWDSRLKKLKKIKSFKSLDLDLLIGLERQKSTLLHNTLSFADGNFTNNALLWGSRGNGKSSLIKSIFNETYNNYENLKLLQLNKKDIYNF